MTLKQELDQIMAPVALLLNIYPLQLGGSGRLCLNQLVKYYEEYTPVNLKEHYGLTDEQIIGFKETVAVSTDSIIKFVSKLTEFVQSDTFEDEWLKVSQAEKEYIIFFHEESYNILREVKNAYELLPINMDDFLNNVKIEWAILIKAFNLPEEFNEFPQNKVQYLKQKKALINLGHSVIRLDGINNDETIYKEKLLKLLLENKSALEILELIDNSEIKLNKYSKTNINLQFIKTKEEPFKKKTIRM